MNDQNNYSNKAITYSNRAVNDAWSEIALLPKISCFKNQPYDMKKPLISL